VPLGLYEDADADGAAVLLPPSSVVPCGCFEPDIGKERDEDEDEIIKEIDLKDAMQLDKDVINMAAIVRCQEVCQQTSGCGVFSFYEDLSLCQLRRGGEQWQRRHSLPNVISGAKTC